MKNNENIENNEENDEVAIKPIKSIKQLVESYYVAKAIGAIRRKRNQSLIQDAKELIPKLDIPKDSPFNELYNLFTTFTYYNIIGAYIAKLAIEDIYNYSFKENPSVMTYASTDYDHLKQQYNNSYTKLSKITLYQHTLDVFNESIKIAKKRRRGVLIPALASLLHDFGKSEKIRIELYGNKNGSIGSNYKPHADASADYIDEILLEKIQKIKEMKKQNYLNILEEVKNIVATHHSYNSKKVKDNEKNLNIEWVQEADYEARGLEMNKINQRGLENE